jgi:hypothetical protein
MTLTSSFRYFTFYTYYRHLHIVTWWPRAGIMKLQQTPNV